MLLHRVKKYDLIVGLGDACQCSQTLRSHDLQRASYPFDWLVIPILTQRVDNFLNGFKEFPGIEDLEFVSSHEAHDTYVSKKYKIIMPHDFAVGRPLAETHPGVREKYARRFNYLYTHASRAKTILVVLMHSLAFDPAMYTEQEVLANYPKLAAAWPHAQVDLLFVAYDKQMPRGKVQRTQLAPHVLKVSANYKSTAKDVVVWDIDRKIMNQIFSRYALNVPFTESLKRKFLIAVAPLLPTSALRSKFRKKHHIEKF